MPTTISQKKTQGIRQGFPWRIFYRAVFIQSAIIVIAVVVSWYGARFFFKQQISREALMVIDTSVAIVLVLVILSSIFCTMWLARKLVFPLGRLLIKTQNLLSGQPEIIKAEDLGKEPLGEWADLETNIDKLRRNWASLQKQSHRETSAFNTMLGAVHDGVIAINRQGDILFYNGSFAIIVDSVRLQKQNAKLWDTVRDPTILDAFDVVLSGKKGHESCLISIEAKDTRYRHYMLSVSPLRQADGAIDGALGIFHDVTDLKSAEQMRIDFVANVSHELRTPLTAIKGYVDTLCGENLPGSARKSLDVIKRHTDRLILLVNDLLDLSAIESGDVLEKEWIDCETVAHTIVKQLDFRGGVQRGGLNNIDILAHVKKVYADQRRLEQVLLNLIDNAVKYSSHDTPIQVIWDSDDRDTLLRVVNQGPPVPLEHQARLFERFYRVDAARSRESGGTGLGLAIVKHIMQRHGGTVWVESTTLQGTIFTCKFPCGK